ncbi:centrosomal protein of 135 kDa isoform X2 [Lepisosteus oculatus]
MSTTAERKFISLRKRLDQLGYRQPLGIESLPLVEKLFSDLVHTTESLRNAKLSAGKTEKESKNLDALLEPYRTENARLVRENNELHLGLLKLQEEKDQQSKDLKAAVRKLEHEVTDLRFLNNQYVHKVRSLEKDGKAKTERIQQLQEKNLQAVVQTPGGKKRTIPFRRQRMQIDELVPPSSVHAPPVSQPHDPYIADLLQVADDRIQELQQEVAKLGQELERAEGGIRHLNKQVEERDREIERLGRALHGGRPHDVVSLEAQSRSNEKLIAHLNLQIEYLQQANRDLERRVQGLQERKQNAASEVADLSARNEELCQELTEIDQLAHQLERDKELVLETADKELQEAKKEIQRQHREIEDFEDAIAKLKAELADCHHDNEKLRDDLLENKEQCAKLEGLSNFMEEEKQRLQEKIEKMTETEKALVLELEGMKSQYGTCGRERSPSRLDAFVKSLEEERDFFKSEAEFLRRVAKGAASPSRSPARGRSPGRGSASRGGRCEAELLQVARERDELQALLDRFERHMEDIQANVKVLTAERDKLSGLHEQAQEELSRLRREAVRSPKSQTSVAVAQAVLQRVEEERDEALADLRRMTMERDSLRDRLKGAQEAALIDREEEEKRVLEVENTVQKLEKERSELRSQLRALKETKAALEDEIKAQASLLARTSEEASLHRAETGSLRLLKEQMEQSLSDAQRRLSVKVSELQNAHERIRQLEERIAGLSRHGSSQQEEVAVLQKTISALDREKDSLQQTVDEKTEQIAALEHNLTNKEKALTDLELTVSEMEKSLDRLRDALGSREREVASLRRQLDAAREELGEVGRAREVALRENRRLQDDLAVMTRENQAINAEMEEAMHEKDELKLRVHSYISEVARIESLLAAKEQENRDMLERFRLAHSQAEDWELKLQQAEGHSSSIRLELLSADTERRHLRERVGNLEREIQEHMSAQQAYEAQITTLAKTMSRLEDEVRAAHEERSSALADLASVRELCVKLDSSKEMMSRQLTSKSMEYERAVGELEDVKSEAELLKKQLSSERLTIKNLETLLSTNREKEFQIHLSSHEKESELKILRDRLTLADSKAASQTREVAQLRSKVTQLQTELDVLKRQLTTERFERERAVQEMRRQGISFSSLRSSSPLSSSPSPRSRSPERSALRSPEHAAERSLEK